MPVMPLNVLPVSHLLFLLNLLQRTANQSAAAATQHIAYQSPTAVVTRRTSNQSLKSTPPLTVILSKSIK